MKLVPDGSSWRVTGPGSERARIAYARLEGERVVYEIDRSDRRDGGPGFPVLPALSEAEGSERPIPARVEGSLDNPT
jgi:hypothetical protein